MGHVIHMNFRFSFAILFCVSISSYVSAQTFWDWSYPKPQGNTLRGLILNTDTFGIALGDAGTVMRRSNGTFLTPLYPMNLPIRAGASYRDTMWIVGDSGYILRSLNNGASWTSQRYSAQHLTFRGVQVRDKNTLWVAGDSGYILYSTSGGASFTKQSNSYTVRLNDIGFARQNVYVCGDSGTLLRGASYGAAGYAKFPTGKTFPFRALDMDTSNIFIAGDFGYILRRTVADEQFVNDTTLPSGIVGKDLMFNDIAYFDRYVIVVGNDGIIRRSVDTGWTWTAPASQTTEHLYSIRFASDFGTSGIAWVVGEGGTFLRTTNYGSTWTRLDSGIRQTVYAAGGSPNGTLYVTSTGGIAFRSIDNGTTWSRDSLSSAGARLMDIAFSDNGFGLLATYDSKVLRTIDSGRTWAAQNLGTASTLILGVAAQGNAGLACGANGQLFRTVNKGTSWTSVTSNTTRTLYDVDIFGSNAIAVGDNGAAIYSTNLGQSWASVTSGATIRFNRVGFAHSPENAIAVGQTGTVRRTTNHGLNWTSVTSGTQEQLNDVLFHDDINGIVAGDQGTILKTTNFGASWTRDNSHTTVDLKGAIIINGTDAFVAGNKTTILFTTNSALPVELISFNAMRLGDAFVELDWKVAREVNNRGFILEKLERDWQEIAFIRSRGTSQSLRTYSFLDPEASSARTEYRLSQIDLDGSRQRLATVEIGGGEAGSDKLRISPNPATDHASISFILSSPANVRITIMNALGMEVSALADEEFSHGTHSISFDTRLLTSGVYLITIDRDGHRTSQRLIVE